MEPASPTLPDKNQLIAKVSRVPKVRQLIALRIDRECVSPPLNKITPGLSNRTIRFNHITARPALTSHRPDASKKLSPGASRFRLPVNKTVSQLGLNANLAGGLTVVGPQ
jgi:hypothetical protein